MERKAFNTAVGTAIALAVCMTGPQAGAQDAGNGAQADWPTEPITLLVGFAPGGNNDLLARTLGPEISERLGVPIVVENRPGAGGTIATAHNATQPADGYTMQLCDISTHAISPAVYDLPYDPIADFAPIVQLTSVPLLLVANPDAPWESVGDMVEAAKADPDSLSYASSGSGSAQHLAFELLKSSAGIEAVHIPFNGSAPALTAVIGGHVPVMIDGTAVPHVRSGDLKALAVTSAERTEAFPDLPTLAEAGVPGYEYTSWHGLCYPAGVPAEIVQRVNQAVNEVLQEQAIQEQFAKLNMNLVGGSPEEFAAFVESEAGKMQELVEISGAAKDAEE